MWNNFDIIPSNIFGEEVLQYIPSVYREYRGEIWTTFHSTDHPAVSHINVSKQDLNIHGRFSKSYKGVLRGLHWDTKTWKLVQAAVGDIYLVVLDVRKDSKTYGQWESYIISEKTRNQVLVPPGFANGHFALTNCIFHYNLFYTGEFVDVSEQFTIRWNNPEFNIEWPTDTPILSKRDKNGD